MFGIFFFLFLVRFFLLDAAMRLRGSVKLKLCCAR